MPACTATRVAPVREDTCSFLFLYQVLSVPRVVHSRWLDVRRNLETPGQMPFAGRVDLARLVEALPRVLADRLQEAEAHQHWALVFDNQQ